MQPIDVSQCQAFKPNGHSFMTLGGKPGLERCQDPPTHIVVENQPGEDQRRGAMSLCTSCLTVARKQLPEGNFTEFLLTNVGGQ